MAASDPLTRHCCIGFGIERGIVEANAHEVDGVLHYGVAGALLDDVLADTYRREVDWIIPDLEAIAAAMIHTDQQRGSADAKRLADRLHALATNIERVRTDQRRAAAEAVTAGDRLAGDWTADYRQGGRPITEHDDVGPENLARAAAVDELERRSMARKFDKPDDDVPPAPVLDPSFEGGDGESIGDLTDPDELDPDDEIQP